MLRSSRYSPEVRQRAVKMVFDHRQDYPSEWATMTSIAEKFDATPETLRKWVRRAEVDSGVRPGLTTDERKSSRSSRRRTESCVGRTILKDASIFFATELDGRPKK